MLRILLERRGRSARGNGRIYRRGASARVYDALSVALRIIVHHLPGAAFGQMAFDTFTTSVNAPRSVGRASSFPCP